MTKSFMFASVALGAATVLSAAPVQAQGSGPKPKIEVTGSCGNSGMVVYIRNTDRNRSVRVTYKVTALQWGGGTYSRERTVGVSAGGSSRIGCTLMNSGSPDGHGTTPAHYKILGYEY